MEFVIQLIWGMNINWETILPQRWYCLLCDKHEEDLSKCSFIKCHCIFRFLISVKIFYIPEDLWTSLAKYCFSIWENFNWWFLCIVSTFCILSTFTWFSLHLSSPLAVYSVLVFVLDLLNAYRVAQRIQGKSLVLHSSLKAAA